MLCTSKPLSGTFFENDPSTTWFSVFSLSRIGMARDGRSGSEYRQRQNGRRLSCRDDDRFTAERLAAMALRLVGHIELPANRSKGGFDHADIHPPTDRLYVAHTSNDAIDVIDSARDRYIESLPGLTAVAGSLDSGELPLLLTYHPAEETSPT